MAGQVVAINGEASYADRAINANCVAALEELLEMAKSGEICGIAASYQYHDNLGGYRLAGFVGSFSVLGAVNVMQDQLINDHRGELE